MSSVSKISQYCRGVDTRLPRVRKLRTDYSTLQSLLYQPDASSNKGTLNPTLFLVAHKTGYINALDPQSLPPFIPPSKHHRKTYQSSPPPLSEPNQTRSHDIRRRQARKLPRKQSQVRPDMANPTQHGAVARRSA